MGVGACQLGGVGTGSGGIVGRWVGFIVLSDVGGVGGGLVGDGGGEGVGLEEVAEVGGVGDAVEVAGAVDVVFGGGDGVVEVGAEVEDFLHGFEVGGALTGRVLLKAFPLARGEMMISGRVKSAVSPPSVSSVQMMMRPLFLKAGEASIIGMRRERQWSPEAMADWSRV